MLENAATLENATEFSVVSRWSGKDRHDVLVLGQRRPIARMQQILRDANGGRVITDALRVLGSDLLYSIGLVDPGRPGRAFDFTENLKVGHEIGRVSMISGARKGEASGEFEQYGLGVLTRVEERGTRLVRYSSADCSGFSIAKPRGSSRCEFTIHDERVSRILVLAAYYKMEQRIPVVLTVGGLVIAGIARVLSGR
jgi:hypothetical protein